MKPRTMLEEAQLSTNMAQLRLTYVQRGALPGLGAGEVAQLRWLLVPDHATVPSRAEVPKGVCSTPRD